MKPDRKQNSPKSAASSAPVSSSHGGTNGFAPKDETEPSAGMAETPIWLIVLLALLFYWGQLYLDNHAGGFDPKVYEPFKSYAQVDASNAKSPEQLLVETGKARYDQFCMVCHQVTGLGVAGQFPPLAGSEWVTEPNPARLIRIPLHGLTGPITVKNQPWNLNMAALGATLSNEDLAAILSYVRQAWGNQAPIVTADQVDAVLKETSDRPKDGSRPWTAEELLKVPVAP